MKRIVPRNTLLETSFARRGIKRHESSAQDDELGSLLSEIDDRYDGSLRAFFADLGKGSSKDAVNSDKKTRKARVASTK